LVTPVTIALLLSFGAIVAICHPFIVCRHLFFENGVVRCTGRTSPPTVISCRRVLNLQMNKNILVEKNNETKKINLLLTF
jgi:hypothetical protein